MTIKIGINGFGRIGRCIVRALEAEKIMILSLLTSMICAMPDVSSFVAP